MAASASLVRSEESTRWPVKAALQASRAVASSRISPTKTMSGFRRKKLRRTSGNPSPAASLTCTCVTPGRSYSTGPSTVQMESDCSMRSMSAAWRVVVLPEPVGLVTSTRPLGWWKNLGTTCATFSARMRSVS
jgi:hypothetical protein